MNGWHYGADYAARERIHRFQQEAHQARMARAGRAAYRPVRAAWRRRAAAALHRLADVLAPQPEATSPGGLTPGLEPSGGPPPG